MPRDPFSRWRYSTRILFSGCDQAIYQQDLVVHRTVGRDYEEEAGGLKVWHIFIGPRCRADYGDLRFTDRHGRELAYYLWPDYDSSSARFCVRLEGADAAGGLLVWYGNPTAATTSDGDATYIFFDHFEGTALDTTKWTNSGNSGEVTVANGEAVLRAAAISSSLYNRYITSNTSFATVGDITVEIRAKLDRTNANRWGVNVAAGRSDRSYYGSGEYGASHKYMYTGFAYWYYGGSSISSSVVPTNWVTYQFDIYNNGTTGNARTTDVVGYTGKSVSFNSFPYVELYIATWDPGNQPKLHVDYAFVRAYSATPPSLLSAGPLIPVIPVIPPSATETYTGTIQRIAVAESGSYIGIQTETRLYLQEISAPATFGATVDLGDRAGTPYDVAIANNGANIIEGRGILADIFRFDGVQVGTYTAGGPVRAVAVAQKNGLYAAAGSDDGKYYIFSKDESSSWYLLHSSDSEEPVTALAMSWRGEIAVIGRADGSVVLYTTTDAPPPDSQMTIYAIKDGQPYIGKPVSVSTADISDPDEWTPLYNNLRTDSDGKIVISTHTGHYYQININNGEKIVVIQASSATPIHSVVFRSPLIYEKYSYDVQYNPSSQAIEMAYTDNEGPATVSWSIVRTDTYSEVYSHTTSGATTATATYPISEPDISYKVNVKVQRGSGGSIQNMWFITPQNASPLALPFWDENIQNAVFIVFLMILGGVFYYSTGAKGALIVALVAALFRYFSWITVPWFWIIAAAVFAFLANIAEGA